eukprot:TRINITY_DN35049_c0_g1_i1.p1 TRINITY_DN35049_c0_g1~~TRINITY_DN35049_c0_g1_i1.p1  ORF type:complete len:315 (+),score=89.08 TRINITY_DN35049_c0_g1_i1:33-977(+)
MAAPAAPFRRQLDLQVFEQTVCKLFNVFGVRHDVKNVDSEVVDMDLDVRHVLNHLLAEQEVLFRQWQFEEARYFEERLRQLDRSWQRRWKVLERGSICNVDTPASLKPEKTQEESSRGSTCIKASPDDQDAQTEEAKIKATEERNSTAAEEQARQKATAEEVDRRRAAEEEAKKLAAEEEKSKAADEEARRKAAAEGDGDAQLANLGHDLCTKVEASQDSQEKLVPEYTSRAESGSGLGATPLRKDDADKRGYALTSSTPATSPSKSPLTGARGPPASPAVTPKPFAESPAARPRSAVSQNFARLLGVFGGSRG